MTSSPIVIVGTASDNELLTGVKISLNGGSEITAAGTTNWNAVVSLKPGLNTVTATAYDAAGPSKPVTLMIYFDVLSPFTLVTNGIGTVTPSIGGQNLFVGIGYTLVATPGLNNVFSNWTSTGGAEFSTAPILKFVMTSNLLLQANIVANPFIPTAGLYSGLFYETNEITGVTHPSSGFLSIKVKTNFAFSGKLLLDGDSVALSGKFNVDGTVTKTVPRAKVAKSALTVSLALDFANGTDRATGSVSTTNWTAQLQADRAVFGPENNTTVYATNYTMLIPGSTSGIDLPGGYGYAALAVNTNGILKISGGGLSDGQPFKQAVPISKNGEWPLYVPLYKSERVYINGLTLLEATNKSYYVGSALGWLTITNNAPQGTISWIKTVGTNLFYSNGFTNEATVLGSLYTPPALGERALSITTGMLTLTNGNLSAALVRNITLATNNAILATPTNQNVKLSLTAKTGLLSGSFESRQHEQSDQVQRRGLAGTKLRRRRFPRHQPKRSGMAAGGLTPLSPLR